MGRPTKKELWRKAIAAGVTKLSEDVIAKLAQAFAIGATVEQASDYADIHPATYYRWMEKYPELCEYFDRMRQRLPLKAKENIAKTIQAGNINDSWRLLEKTESGIYGEKLKLEHSGSMQSDDLVHPEDEALRLEFKERLKDNIRKRWQDKQKNKDKKDENPTGKPANS